jgi:hypothetical protein
MTYIFAFLGEFGYELFNWQGVIRKFSKTISSSDRIICCSRANLYPLYETASQYIDFSAVSNFRKSVASMYFALHPGDFTSRKLKAGLKSFIFRLYENASKYVDLPDVNIFWRSMGSTYRALRPRKTLDICSKEHLAFDQKLKKELQSFVLQQLGAISSLPSNEYVLIFSSDKTKLNGCTFGCDRSSAASGDPVEGNIYEALDLENDVFEKILPDFSVRRAIEEKLGWNLETPFVLVQTRSREIVVRSKDLVPKEQLIEELVRRFNVVLLSFRTGRYLDSYSSFNKIANCYSYDSKSFLEQACLVHFAKHCVFFTEGDFGSHIYVPPFMGKDVFAIAPRSVYQLDTLPGVRWSTTPIEFWNRKVFRFGGQIFAKISEDVFDSPQSMLKLVEEIILH